MKKPYRKATVLDPDASFATQGWTDELDSGKAADKLLADANEGDRRALDWVRRFADEGVTPSIVRQIGMKLLKLPMTVQLIPAPVDKTFRWRVRLQDSSQLADDEFSYLLAMLVIRGGFASRFKKCEFAECVSPYFLGNAKAKYCSDKCGSNVRVRKMRHNQKARQML